MAILKREYGLQIVNDEADYQNMVVLKAGTAAEAEAAESTFRLYEGERFEVVSRVATDWEPVK